ncbi:MAG: hypothetical protein UU64_C0021G0006 [candidate division WWE3 bacterium GW2011_GWF2_41_45]|uniref:Histidine kinase N-terminal 7TM region domain-containing protein n=3 Tax=Katanobacteria TaxID=422282 RepID=A0A1F4VZT3_UNCKA|nr:MAG: hypothetical protein UU55_C0005G0091 [candidate division WWE3 bacterium GW2011_GWC2_41_23]KKS08759.1 MAG: hypothetical protein UU64_C0021G0006 [candidate division WWE3 bacterium GW2011_GWF2_41_45]KKS11794.1 MAG: hypothetical protein UU68_C0011G0007 [candidate division WWE3 bacterium GW2011_GWF1_41_53]KKS19410.1 MAG: hypothetical protein UU79_C0020G0007 [candidate division WWE3 bacterium GW2011_GWE1_41_72]KKS30092.1 MAG: hypothetical protein UU90_C0005G0052 [candidate division WWE3 bacte
MRSKIALKSLVIGLFLAYSLWWLYILLAAGPEDSIRDYFSDSYGIVAGLGGFLGLIFAHKWDGWKSYVGKSLILFSLGLFFQFCGQLSYSIEYYIYGIENSYPSVGEVFFFSSIFFYIFGVWFVAKSAGTTISIKGVKKKLIAYVFPLLMIAFSYFMFINGTDFESYGLIANILTLAYPIGQAIYVSMAILTSYLAFNLVGGAMRRRVFFILFACIFQYAADSTFLYKTIQETWMPADISEYMFVVSYFLMSMAFIDFLAAYEFLQGRKK